MTQSIIDIGDAPNDGTGDPVREAFNKCNNNFTELYTTGSGAPLNSPAFTGNPTAPTPTAGDNDTSIATTAFVTTAVAAGSSAGGAGPPQGRLTLQTGVPVMTTTQSAKTTIYYTPYVGDRVPLYDGTNTVMTTFAELSVATTDTTKSPAAIGVSKVNDWFVWNDGGTVRIGHGPDWTSDTVRSAGTALTRVHGIWLNNAAITNGPAASRGTYVGTTRSTGASQLTWTFGDVVAGATSGLFYVWNAYNRVNVASFSGDTADSWTYATAVVRPANVLGNIAHFFVRGLDEDAVFAMYGGQIGSGTAFAAQGIGLDTNTAFTGSPGTLPGGGLYGSAYGYYTGLPGIGLHSVYAVEYSHGGTATFYGDNNNPGLFQNGLLIQFRA